MAKADFSAACGLVLRFLQERFGFGLWMVTRVESDNWIVLAALDRDYGVSTGDTFRWADSFCARMVAGAGPRIAAASDEVEAYRTAPIAQALPIKAYVGAPIPGPSGEVFGTLCGIDPEVQDTAIEAESELISLLAGMLGNLLAVQRERDVAERRAERAEIEARVDALTGLGNRRGWESVISREEARSKRFGDPVGVISIDIDGLKRVNDTFGHAAGDDILRRAAEVLRNRTRDTDYVARMGGDEFSLLAVECTADGLAELEARLQADFAAAGIAASTGRATRGPSGGVAEALRSADASMYAARAVRRSSDQAVAQGVRDGVGAVAQ